jgi:Tfp pilus assembly protein PilF
MRKSVHLFFCVVVGLATTLGQKTISQAHGTIEGKGIGAIVQIPQGRNEIAGTVFNESRRPLADIYVELFNEVSSTIGHTKTNSSGRFSFNGLPNGTFRVKVLPLGTDYMEQTQEVTLAAISVIAGGGSDRQNIDISLRLNPRATAGPFASGPGVIFAQDVPSTAQKLYEQGIAYLREKKEKEGFESLKKSIEIFPTYYLALDRLGAEYAIKGSTNRIYWEAGLVLLTKAVEVNPRGFSSVFGLGWIQYQLGLNSQAIETLKRATIIYGKGADAYLWLGKALKRAATLDQAEVAFKRANELTEGKASEVHWQMAGLKTDPKGIDKEKIRVLIRQLREKPDVKQFRSSLTDPDFEN